MSNIERFFRSTISHPEGWYCHDGDCYIFSTDVCTCGLLHELKYMIGNGENPEDYFPEYHKQRARQECRHDQMLRSPNPYKEPTEEDVAICMKMLDLMMSGKLFPKSV